MKPLKDIINESTDESGVIDLEVAIGLIDENLQQSRTPINPTMALKAFMSAQGAINEYLGDLILSVAAEVNALPNGYDVERGTYSAYLTFANASSLYEVVEAEHAAQSGLIVPHGEVPPL